MKTVFLRVLEAEDKATALLATIRDSEAARRKQRFDVDPTSFASVPRSPFAYWVSERLRRLFKELPPFEAEGRVAKQGLATADDFRFVRVLWEVPPALIGEQWFPFAKGGNFSPFYADVYLAVNWERSGEEIKNNLNERGGIRSNVWMLRDTAGNCFFRPAVTWPLRTQGGLSLRAMPAGCIFGHKGPAAFVETDDSDELLALLAVTNGDAFKAMVDMQMAFGSYEVGVLQRTPLPRFTEASRREVAKLARRAWSLKRSLDTRTETSHAFTLPALLQVAGADLAARAATWSEHVRTVEADLLAIQAELDERCFVLYDIDEADRRAITEGFGSINLSAGTAETDADADAESESEADDEGEPESSADNRSLAAELVSWAVGVAFGRFDVRFATGARALPPEPEPFDPLPVCSPAMLTGDDAMPLARPPTGYPLAFPETGVLVDDPGHARDLSAAVRAVFDVVFGAGADRWWTDVAALLDPKGNDLRVWLAGSFFEHHLKRHSKSRRKAPIVWQLGTPLGPLQRLALRPPPHK